MYSVKRADERGVSNYTWLKSFHSFSFGDYFDPEEMNFGSLRVINDDFIAPGGGFDTHPHANMEIITYVIDGKLEHRDSLGNGRVISAGEFQYMSAGRGVKHSEFNPSSTDPVHLLQMWIMPRVKNTPPSYAEAATKDISAGQLIEVASGYPKQGGFRIYQDCELSIGMVDSDSSIETTLSDGQLGWLQVVTGNCRVAGMELASGDALKVVQESQLKVESDGPCKFLLFKIQE